MPQYCGFNQITATPGIITVTAQITTRPNPLLAGQGEANSNAWVGATNAPVTPNDAKWAQIGYLYRRLADGRMLANVYVEVNAGPNDPTDYFVLYFGPPQPGSHRYTAVLDEFSGTWTFFLDREFLTQYEHRGWVNVTASKAQYTLEINGAGAVVIGTEGDPCEFSECEYELANQSPIPTPIIVRPNFQDEATWLRLDAANGNGVGEAIPEEAPTNAFAASNNEDLAARRPPFFRPRPLHSTRPSGPALARLTPARPRQDPREFWTPERMAAARYVQWGPTRPSFRGEARASLAITPVPDPTKPPYASVGALFYTMNGEERAGSAVVIGANAILTAAHALSLDGHPALQMLFVPAYSEAKAPFGTWADDVVVVPAGWLHGNPPGLDYGVVLLERDAEGRDVGDVVKALPLVYDVGLASTTTWLAVGYSESTMSQIIGTYVGTDSDGAIALSEPFTPRASGGPWFLGDKASGVINGINSQGSDEHEFSPYFDDAVRIFIEQALAGPSGGQS